ncbi:MAG: UbiA family prenyltransferase [Candidatus Kariarchaeaceae archaeon]|jgi:protoheme IX farnesyltransferase
MTEKISSTSISNVQHTFIPFSLYSELIKGKQAALLVFTGLAAYLISGYPHNIHLGEILFLVIGLFFAVSGSTLFNMVIDRDIDAIMKRTKNRALPSGKISSKVVLWHAFVFTSFGIAISGLINLLTMIVIFFGFFFDVVVYSILLKRRTRLSIIFGGIAGGLPAVAGRAAVINGIDIVSILFLAFILFWIPLHILTLALIPENYKGYCAAGVPMWPVVAGKTQTMYVITISAFLSGLVMSVIGYFLELHIITQLPLLLMGLYTIGRAIINLVSPTDSKTFKLFKFASIFMFSTFLWLLLAVVINPPISNMF